MNLGENIKSERKKKRIKQSELAYELGVTVRTIQNYESGNREPNIETIKKIADIFDIPIIKLIGDDPNSDLSYELIKHEVDKEGDFNIKVVESLDKLHKKPSEIKKEKRIKEELNTILDDFDKFASNKFVENDIGYKFNDFSVFEQDELFRFMYDMLRMKTTEIKSRKK